MLSLKHLGLVMVVAASASSSAHAANPLTPPSDWSAYNSGGPLRGGKAVTLPDGRKGVVVGDFREIPNGTASSSNPGYFRYAVMVPNAGPVDASKDCPAFGLSVVTVEFVDGKMSVSGGKDADAMIADYQKRLGDYRQRVLSATAAGRDIQAKADKMFAKWNERNDRSVKKFTTVEGYTSLVTDMALAGVADKAKKSLKTTGDLDKIFKEALIDAAKEKLSGDLPLGAPGPKPETAVAAELTKANIKAILTQKLKDVPENGRAEVLTKVLVQFGALAIDGDGEDLGEVAFEALADVAVEVGLSRYPIAGPLAKEALELGKQLRGYLMTIEKLSEADVEFTKAMNAFNDSYGARQALTLMQKNRKDLLKAASNSLYAEDPKLEDWLVGRVAERMDADERMMAKLLKSLPPDPKAPAVVGPQAPEDATKLKPFVVKDGELESALDTWRIPGFIERAGQDVAVFEGERLNLRGKTFRVEREAMGLGNGRGDRDIRLSSGTPDLMGDMRRIFSGPGFGHRGLDLVPALPPKPTLDEKQMLERDCRLKRMAEAERVVPRIGPQVRQQRMFRSLLNDLPEPTRGLDVYRFDNTKPMRVVPLFAKPANGAGVLRD